MKLFFDTETSGKANFKLPVGAFQPTARLVQLGMILTDDNDEMKEEYSNLIKPSGFLISEEVSKIHGITHEQAVEDGAPLEYVIDVFNSFLTKCHTIIGHNIQFDERVMYSERANVFGGKKICTMLSTTSFCKLKNTYGGFKWPKLTELHYKLFGTEATDQHSALGDVRTTLKCYKELRKRGFYND